MQAISGNYLTRTALCFLSASLFHCPAIATETPLPDFSGIWGRNQDFFELPLSGPGPIDGQVRSGQGQPIIGNHTNSMLKPEAAEVLKKRGEIAASGVVAPDPVNQCWPEPTPLILAGQNGVQILQQKDEITLFYIGDHKVRHVRLNDKHPAQLTPTWQGDSIGHYEGDTLVIDTVGQKVGPLSRVDFFGTPFSPALHVTERYRLIDGVEARDAVLKHENNYGRPGRIVPMNGSYGRGPIDPDTAKKGLQVEITVEDPGIFTTPWSALITYRQATGTWPEMVCAETGTIGANKEVGMPQADRPDF